MGRVSRAIIFARWVLPMQNLGGRAVVSLNAAAGHARRCFACSQRPNPVLQLALRVQHAAPRVDQRVAAFQN
eukprot:7274922-Lingulodinium_polyedra.AAC.1